ncbi:hypothetical protein JKY79_00195 [Candidatus Babeliales bacterium]|nr:hypothetical protein [Candidatus Babeliales bacterium]
MFPYFLFFTLFSLLQWGSTTNLYATSTQLANNEVTKYNEIDDNEGFGDFYSEAFGELETAFKSLIPSNYKQITYAAILSLIIYFFIPETVRLTTESHAFHPCYKP